jgi:hypothetical protein
MKITVRVVREKGGPRVSEIHYIFNNYIKIWIYMNTSEFRHMIKSSIYIRKGTLNSTPLF